MIRYKIMPRLNDLFSETVATRKLLSTICEGVLCGICGSTVASSSASVSVIHCLSSRCHSENEQSSQ